MSAPESGLSAGPILRYVSRMSPRVALVLVTVLVLGGCAADTEPSPTGGPVGTGGASTRTSAVVTSTTATPRTTTADDPIDALGRRLIVASAGPVFYTCGWAIFPDGEPPRSVSKPAVDVDSLIGSAGLPGVDQDDFFQLYEWSAILVATDWISLLGFPLAGAEHSDWYPGAFGTAEFVRNESSDWKQLSSGWCDVTPHPGVPPEATRSLVELMPDDWRRFLVRRTVEGPADTDWAVIEEMQRSDWVELVYPPRPSEWRRAPGLPPDPDSHLLPMEINESNCASGQPPSDRDIDVISVPYQGGLSLVVMVEPVAGGALCPGNPWYPITVDLGEPLGDRALYDGKTWPPQAIWPQTDN